MEEKNRHSTRPGTGLAKHGNAVSLAPARAASSHARRLYRSRYAGRYRHSRLIFAFDLLLLGVVGILAVFNLNLAYRHYVALPAGLKLVFDAPGIIASESMPLQLTVSADDGKRHDGVRLHWNIPPWVEVVEAFPPFAADGSVALGTVKPGSAKTSRLLVKVRGQVGEKVPFGFSVSQYDPLFIALTYSGTETRTIGKTALSVRAAVPGAEYEAGSAVPLIIENTGRDAAESVILRLASQVGAAGAVLGKSNTYTFGRLGPGEKRLVFVELDAIETGKFDLSLELQDVAQVVQSYRLSATAVEGCGLRLSAAEDKGDALVFDYSAEGKARLMVIGGPLSPGEEPYTGIQLDPAKSVVSYQVLGQTPTGSWDVVPVSESRAKPCVGKRRSFVTSDALPALVEARYFAATGDQLGVGPLPPKVGEATTYWIVWSIGPFNSDLAHVKIAADLPLGVSATEKYSAAVAGEFGFENGRVEWTANSLQLVGTEKVSLAFEVVLTPLAEQAGSVVALLGETRVMAKTPQEDVIDLKLPNVDTALATDAKARGRGQVQR
jgi:hypothetical protein